jgi:lysophospholipase L1-like esterase
MTRSTINNGASGLVVRTAINAMTAELYAERGPKMRRLARIAFNSNPSDLPPLLVPTAWASGVAITAGMVRANDGKWYVAATSGTTLITTPPVHTSGQIVWDGVSTPGLETGVGWAFIGYAQSTADDPDAPTVSISGSATLANNYLPVSYPDVFDAVGCDAATFGGVYWQPTVFHKNASTLTIGGGAVRLPSDAKAIEITIPQSVRSPRIVIDGRFLDLSGDVDSGSERYKLITFGTAKVRTFEVRGSRTDFVMGGIRIGAKEKVLPPPAAEITAVFIGDSMWAGSTGYGWFLAGGSEPNIICDKLGWGECRNMSMGGTGIIATGSGTGSPFYTFGQRVPEALTFNPDVWVTLCSTNDRDQTPTAITAGYVAMFTAIRAGSTAPIIVLGAQCIDDTSGGKIADLETAVAAAVTAMADPSIYFIPYRNAVPVPFITNTWNNSAKTGSVNSPDFIAADGLHPAELGTRKRAEMAVSEIKRLVLPFL